MASWDARRGLRAGTAVVLALLVNAGLIALIAGLPMRLPPEAPVRRPVEVVFLPNEPAPTPAAPEPAAPAPTPEPPPATEVADEPVPAPSPAPRSAGTFAPEADLPETGSASGVVALDCVAAFDEEGRRVACAGGEVTLGYELDREAWSDLAGQVPAYGPARPEAPTRFGEAGDPRLATDPDSFERLRAQGEERKAAIAAREAYAEGVSPIASSGAEGAVGQGADLLAPPSFIRSWTDRRAADNEADLREEAETWRALEESDRD